MRGILILKPAKSKEPLKVRKEGGKLRNKEDWKMGKHITKISFFQLSHLKKIDFT